VQTHGYLELLQESQQRSGRSGNTLDERTAEKKCALLAITGRVFMSYADKLFKAFHRLYASAFYFTLPGI